MEIGASEMFDVENPPRRVMRAIARAGIKHVMIYERRKGFARNIKFAQNIGLEIPYVHLHDRSINALWRTDEHAAKRAIKQIEKSIKICKKHGVKVAVMHPRGDYNEFHAMLTAPLCPPNYDAGLKNFQKIATIATQNGVTIAIENLSRADLDPMDFLLNNIPAFGFCYDCAHHFLYAPDRDFLHKYGARCVAVHINDLAHTPHGDTHHLIPFDGEIDFSRVKRALATAKYAGVMVFEIDRHRDTYARLTLDDFYTRAVDAGKKLGTFN
jgi:sugar phosphate isomerase/epimerase